MCELSIINKSDKRAYIQVFGQADIRLYCGEIKSGDIFKKSLESDIKRVTVSDTDLKESGFMRFFSGLGYALAAVVMLFVGEWSNFRKNISLPFELVFDEIPNSISLELHNQEKTDDIKAFKVISDGVFKCETVNKGGEIHKQFIQAQMILAFQFLLGFSPIIAAFVYSLVTARSGLAIFFEFLSAAVFCLFIRFFNKNLKLYKKLKSCNNK